MSERGGSKSGGPGVDGPRRGAQMIAKRGRVGAGEKARDGQNRTRPLHVWDGGALPGLMAPSRRFLSVLCATQPPPRLVAPKSRFPVTSSFENAGRPASLSSEDFPRDRGFPLSPGSSPVAPVLGGESFSTPVRGVATRGFCQQFQDSLAIHKSSTVQPLLSPGMSETPQDFHSLIHRRRHACPAWADGRVSPVSPAQGNGRRT
jgi:hypothetical protein